MLVCMLAALLSQSPDIESRVSRLERENSDMLERIVRLERLVKSFDRSARSVAVEPKPEPSPTGRTWTIDGRPLVAEFDGFTDSEATLITEDGSKIGVKLSEMSATDREWVKDEMRARKDLEDKLSSGAFKRCPNHKCVRGKIYGPVESNFTVANGGGVANFSTSSKRPVGVCPVCSGRGVVPNR